MSKPLYIEWSEVHKLNIPIIDEQHRAFVAILNTFHFLLQKGAGYKIINRNRAILIQHFAELHFVTEEHLMKISEYPHLDEHIEMHKKIMKGIHKTVKEVIATGDPQTALEFLRNWWLTHISKEDREFADYVNAKGISL
ncbi:MAG: hemerythrin family protein [Spirochaetaceae bacterium]